MRLFEQDIVIVNNEKIFNDPPAAFCFEKLETGN